VNVQLQSDIYESETERKQKIENYISAKNLIAQESSKLWNNEAYPVSYISPDSYFGDQTTISSPEHFFLTIGYNYIINLRELMSDVSVNYNNKSPEWRQVSETFMDQTASLFKEYKIKD
jgi:hypothetical protein